LKKVGIGMAEIRPFRGIRYNQRVIPDLAGVLSPPYDIISAHQQNDLYQSSEYNFVRIEYNRETPQDTAQDNRYTRAKTNIENWLRQNILKIDFKPALYIHEHHFTCQGKRYHRQNIIACVKLEEWDTKIIRPHENIIPRAKSDRMSMLYTCQANTSPVLAMYQDPEKIIANLIKSQEKKKPVINFEDPWGDRHKMWAMTRSEDIQSLQGEIAKQPLYIADGHHRYDSALTYRRERMAQTVSFTGEEGFNFVMTSLIDFADPGLVILPTHRLVSEVPEAFQSGLKSQLQKYFEIEEIPLNDPDLWKKVDSLLTGMKPDMRQVRLAMFGPDVDRLSILTLRDFSTINQLMPASHEEVYKKLDVSLVDHIILEKLLAYDKEKENLVLDYTHDRFEAVERVKNQEFDLAFILNPVGPEIIKNIADIGDRMPRTSTYFYPKSPAGLVFYKW
jgi:uncharacterized protein (DUF1015 family)